MGPFGLLVVVESAGATPSRTLVLGSGGLRSGIETGNGDLEGNLWMKAKLPPGVNGILFNKNLNYQIIGEDLYDLFGRYGSRIQIRIDNQVKTKGTVFVVFDDVMDAKNALERLNGFHFQGRYIVVLYHVPAKQDAAAATAELARREQELVLAEEVQYQGRGLMGLVPFSHL